MVLWTGADDSLLNRLSDGLQTLEGTWPSSESDTGVVRALGLGLRCYDQMVWVECVRKEGGRPSSLLWCVSLSMVRNRTGWVFMEACSGSVVAERGRGVFLGAQQPLAPPSDIVALLALYKVLHAAEVCLPLPPSAST